MYKILKKIVIWIIQFMYDTKETLDCFIDYIRSRFFSTPKVLSIEESLEIILQEKVSVSRFGDGELKIIQEKSIGFQEYDVVLAQKLKQVLQSKNDNVLIAIPDVFSSLNMYTDHEKNYWRKYLSQNRNQWYKYVSFKNIYLNAFISRCYLMHKDKSWTEYYYQKWKQVWKNRRIVLVEGEMSRVGVGNDLFDEAKDIKRILAPKINAFNVIEDIKKYILLNFDKNILVLLALGPTASILSYELALEGIQTLDIGHIDVEYEWYHAKAEQKIPLENRYVNELMEGRKDTFCDDKLYQKQIVKIIK